MRSSPRSWGCFYLGGSRQTIQFVFPTLVGVFLQVISAVSFSPGSSPRSWGCFCRREAETDGRLVFPTLVGVFPYLAARTLLPRRLPHARGGVSLWLKAARPSSKSSPRSWGCFRAPQRERVSSKVFPTLVGVFRSLVLPVLLISSLPHARGGVSTLEGKGFAELVSSPRSWGCFQRPGVFPAFCIVFPTLVGVFLWPSRTAAGYPRLPHARGGVSAKAVTAARHLASSPRSWGCFPAAPALPRVGMVFPTLVGVFLQMKVCSMIGEGLPHARGGVSNPYDVSRCGKGSSPRSWGCF